jgi:SAM-dependent methyltransferase
VERPTWAPGEIDLERPSAARMYDYYLGGSHNFEIDRTTAQEAMRAMPELPLIMQANRAFLRRVVRFLVEEGVTQFIDIGSGIPTVGNVHEVVHDIDPSRKVVYVDIDPIAVAHSRAILADNPNATIVQADFLQPDLLLRDRGLRRLIDLDRPVAVLLNALLHFVSDAQGPDAILARYRDAIAPGSYLSISHAADTGVHKGAGEAEEIYKRTPTPLHYRTREEVVGLLKGWEPVDPGVVLLPLWRPDPEDRTDEDYVNRITGYGGVGRAI